MRTHWVGDGTVKIESWLQNLCGFLSRHLYWHNPIKRGGIKWVCWHLEVREKQYDKKAYLDFFTDTGSTTPAIHKVLVYIASPDKRVNTNYLGPAPFEEMAMQIIRAKGPSGPNCEYVFKLEDWLIQSGCEDKHVIELATTIRKLRGDSSTMKAFDV
ncbi:hypothetical protein QJS10_CPA09g00203 [Acorus calamus]|uniref:glutathione-specific gamma-glutamylcyclotransferase n=1 Tax=Acorus calamus TaxID=4465 RepID=A0AAV9E347_ACOCL|nr:hypothetical protein QJS10_CPA09g00203 [Acorus calamus]